VSYPKEWHNDILPGYEARYVNQGEAFDGPCRSTIVRRLCSKPTDKAYLYIHGFNDYFFQKEMGYRMTDSGYNFYAVDLRRYGRSLMSWQYPFNVRNIDEYYADIDSAIAQIYKDGNRDITLSGHSTGGLTVLSYVADRADDCRVNRVVTDSPFLEWNMSATMRNVVIPVVASCGTLFKNIKIPQSHCNGYAESLLKQYHGEWEYNTDWKMIYSPAVTTSWIRSINNAQNNLMKRGERVSIPVLIMHSDKAVHGCSWTPAFNHGDAVLDPEMIASRGKKIGKRHKVVTINGGMHDLILSDKSVRDAAYDSIFLFMKLN
jgi:alpha-beta hydrolase superfamily lysophospholipase